MPPPEDSRRKYITLLAVEPKDGTLSCEVLVSFDRMQAVGRRSLGQAKECGYIVPTVLKKPSAIFEGLRRDEDEDRWGEVAMTAMSDSDFAKRMMLLARPAEQFEPTATYDPDGDCIEFLAKPDPFYAERVDDLVTVYYSQETNEIIGSLIKGAAGFCSKVLETMPGFRIEIKDGRVRLVHLFRARLWTSNTDRSDLVTLTNEKLIQVAEESDLETEMCLA
jgi:hypothetical protein